MLNTLALGLVVGSIYALAATGLVLTYRISGVLNFGFGSMAMFGAYVHWQFVEVWHWPVAGSLALILLVLAPSVGLFLDSQLFRRLEGQPMVITMIATAGLVVLVQGIVLMVWGSTSHRPPSLYVHDDFHLPFGVIVSSDELMTLILAATLAVALALVFRYSRIGVAFRAVVDNRAVAGLTSINTGLVSGAAWAVGSSFAALTGIPLAPSIGLLDSTFLPFFMISTVFGAAIIGYMQSLPLAYAGGLALGVVETLIVQYTNFHGILQNLSRAIPFLVVVVAVLIAPKRLRLGALGASFIVRTREGVARASERARLTIALSLFGVLLSIPLLMPESWQTSMTKGMAFGIIYLSLVVLIGYSGQISLGVTAFMGIGAFTAAALSSLGGAWSWIGMLAIPLGALAAVPAGALIGVIAGRLHGLFLALMTLGFAFVVQYLFFSDVRISGGFGGKALPRPNGFTGISAFYYLTLGALAFFALVASNLRSGRTGRVLAAVRDSETASRALGIDVFRYKRVIFGISAFMAGAGAILLRMGDTETVSQQDFLPFFSLFYVTIAVVGGIFHVGGAITAGLLGSIYERLFLNVRIMSDLQFILFGLGATLALAQNPEGLFGEFRRGAAAVGRLVGRGRARAEPLPISGGQE